MNINIYSYILERLTKLAQRAVLCGMLLIIALLPFFSGSLAQAAANKQLALVIVGEPGNITFPDIKEVRQSIEVTGARVISITPPHVLKVHMDPSLAGRLQQNGLITGIHFDAVNPDAYSSYGAFVTSIVEAWNTFLQEQAAGGEAEQSPTAETEENETVSPEAPQTAEDIHALEQSYRKYWQNEGASLKKEYYERLGFSSPPIQKGAGGAQFINQGPFFGKSASAGFFDTSSYMAGDIAVGIFLPEGWTREELINEAFNSMADLDFFALEEPNAHITFIYIKEVDADGLPKPIPTEEADEYVYVNNLRNIFDTHWAFYMSADPDYCSCAPHPRMNVRDWRWGAVITHEVAHLFGAADQYARAPGPTRRFGYLNVLNASTAGCDDKGYFDGCGEASGDLMANGIGLRSYSRGQLGWRDSDGDGILDPLDTYPTTLLDQATATSQIKLTGVAVDQPLLNDEKNLGPSAFSDVTINTITSVQCRLNGLTWLDAAPSDGAFDFGQEYFSFTSPELPNGDYTIECRATNSVGNVETSYARYKQSIEESGILSAHPFAHLAVTPLTGGPNTVFQFDAGGSSDLEEGPLTIRWDFENDGTGDSTDVAASFRYPSPGVYTATLSVTNTHGLTATDTEVITVLDHDLPPVASFTVTPENTHGLTEPSFEVTIDASSSWDDETALEDLVFRWDWTYVRTVNNQPPFWVTESVGDPFMTHTYSLPRLDRSRDFLAVMQVEDAQGNTSQKARRVWTAPYNHPPTLSAIEVKRTDAPALSPRGSYSCRMDNGAPLIADIDVSGSYAYLACKEGGLHIVDISDPSRPSLVGHYDTPDSALDVAVRDSLAYVADDTSLQIIDVSVPADPRQVGSLDNTGADAIEVEGNYAYIEQSFRFAVIDISNPAAPSLVASMRTTDGTSDLTVSGTLAYALSGVVRNKIDVGVLEIFDISDPTNPVLLGSSSDSGYSFGSFVQDGYLYLSDRGGFFKVFDVRDPSNPVLIGSHPISGQLTGVSVSGDIAYVASGRLGVQIFDVSTPSDPVLLSTFDNLYAREISVADSLVLIGGGFSGRFEIAEKTRDALHMSVTSSSDPDFDTTWDGLLEYRWDWDSDGHWDTPYAPLKTTVLSWMPEMATILDVTSEVKDRFGATDRMTKQVDFREGEIFIRGDSNSDGSVDIADPVNTLFKLFVNGNQSIPCMDAADANDDGEIDVADVIATLETVFLELDRIPEPYPHSGYDMTPDDLGCEFRIP